MKDSNFDDRSPGSLDGFLPRPLTERPRERASVAKSWPRLPVIPAIRTNISVHKGAIELLFSILIHSKVSVLLYKNSISSLTSSALYRLRLPRVT
jgi:hypothetical protein